MRKKQRTTQSRGGGGAHTPRAAHLRLADRTARLQRVTAGLAEALTPKETEIAVVDKAVEALGAVTGGLWVVDEEGKGAVLARMSGYSGPNQILYARIPLDAGD